MKNYSRKEYNNNYHKKDRELNPEKYKIRDKIYREKNREKILEYQKIHNKKYPEIKKEYRLKHREQIRNWEQNKIKIDIIYHLSKNLRSRLNMALKNNIKNSSAIRDLGCSIEEFKVYLESQFKDGMNWNNWGKFGWHIDHKIPLSKVDLNNKEELLKTTHYTNLQPLWWRDNLIKSNKILD